MSSRNGIGLVLIALFLIAAGGASVRAFLGLPSDPLARLRVGQSRSRLLWIGFVLLSIGVVMAMRGLVRL